VHLTAVIIY